VPLDKTTLPDQLMSTREKVFDCPPTRIPQLLVSVRDATEAAAALAGGADIIDVKEPRRGPLGMADVSQIEAVLRTVREQNPTMPVSVALGDAGDWHAEQCHVRLPAGLNYIKLGTASCSSDDDWQSVWQSTCRQASHPITVVVAPHDPRSTIHDPLAGDDPRPSTLHPPPLTIPVAYADWRLVASPSPADVVQLAIDAGCAGLLIDTFVKNGQRLFDWLDAGDLSRLAMTCHQSGLWLAAAGSLAISDLPTLSGTGIDIVGIRSAACHRGQRLEVIDSTAVAGFKQVLRQSWNATRRSAVPVRAGCTN